MASQRAQASATHRSNYVAVAVVVFIPLAIATAAALAAVGATGVHGTSPDAGGGDTPDPAGGAGAVALDDDGPDADSDGLGDATEHDLGTNPTDRDTDGDGFPDGMEVACRDRLPGADPLRQDVYVEVDSTVDATLSADARRQLERAFANAPVGNPSGETGIALHLVDSDDGLPQADVVGNREGPGQYDDLADYRSAHFDHDGTGYYYLLVVSNASYEGDPTYAGAGYNGTALVEEHTDTRTMATLLMHELGHAFGIGHGWEGVDDDRYGVEDYRSVMNYNGLYRVLTYADGHGEVGRDEWAFVGEDRYHPSLDCPKDGCAAACS